MSLVSRGIAYNLAANNFESGIDVFDLYSTKIVAQMVSVLKEFSVKFRLTDW